MVGPIREPFFKGGAAFGFGGKGGCVVFEPFEATGVRACVFCVKDGISCSEEFVFVRF
jgi:hypothetical protein